MKTMTLDTFPAIAARRMVLSCLLLLLALCPAQSKTVLLETTMGNIRIELYDDTPLHRDNFLKLVDSTITTRCSSTASSMVL